MSYVPRPTPSFLDGKKKYRTIDGRMTWRGDGRYYQWDELHGEIEVYDRRGWHLGALDAVTGTLIKEAERGRRIHV